MIYRDPTNEILKAYVNLLKGSIMLNGSTVSVGTKISQGRTEYVLIEVDDIENQGTGEQPIYRTYIKLEIVSIQELTEGDETLVNSIAEQILEIISEPEMFLMNNFQCVMVMPGGMERYTENNESNYNIIRTIRMINYVSQIK